MVDLTIMPAGGRGCGKSRAQGGLYACTGMSDDGTPLEHFMLDPPVPYIASAHFQGVHEAPEYITAGWSTDTDLVLMDWVGEAGYACVPDFVEEVRRFGMSRRLPSTFPFETVGGRRVWLALIHAKAAPEFVDLSDLELMLAGFWDYEWCKHKGATAHFPDCLYHDWLLAYRIHGADPKVDKAVPMPWGSYRPLDMVWQPNALKDVFVPDLPGLLPEVAYPFPAFFAVMPVTHLEAVQYVDQDVAGRLDNSGLGVYVVEE